jgi:holo-[acyl-carrier protein] synthase
LIIGLGNDLIDIRRIEKMLERHGRRFVERVFTEEEQQLSGRRAAPAATYAKRFAAKEACAKALGTGLNSGVFWRDMGVVTLASGQPAMRLTGGAARRLVQMTPAGMRAEIHVSLADEYPLAQAIVMIEAVAQPPQDKENS